MIPKLVCGVCGTELQPDDRFCSNCGAKVELIRGETSSATGEKEALPAQVASEKAMRCSLCGNENPSGAEVCASCGAALAGGSKKSLPASIATKKAEVSSSKEPLRFLQSWKLTVVLALVLVGVIITLNLIRKEDAPRHEHMTGGMSPSAQPVISQIDSLQKVVDNDPNNGEATLRLANLLYDVRFFPRAAVMYDRYLQNNPQNADARVDLAITYFEMALVDTVNHQQYLTTAKQEIFKVLKVAPKHQLAYFNLGIINLHTGELDSANTWFKRCADIDPDSPAGKKALELINQHSFTNPS